MKQIKIRPIFSKFNKIKSHKEWVNQIKYIPRKEYTKVWFKDLLNQMEMKEDRKKYSDSIFFFIDDKMVMVQDEKNESIWVDSEKIWSFFHSEFDLNYNETSDLIKGMVEQHFKMRLFTPMNLNFSFIKRWNNTSK